MAAMVTAGPLRIALMIALAMVVGLAYLALGIFGFVFGRTLFFAMSNGQYRMPAFHILNPGVVGFSVFLIVMASRDLAERATMLGREFIETF